MLSIVLTLLFLAAQGVSRSPAQQPATRIALSAVHVGEAKAGSEVRLKIEIMNTSDHDVRISRTFVWGLGEFVQGLEVRDSSGKDVAKSAAYRRLLGEHLANEEQQEIAVSDTHFTLRPGAILTKDIDLSKLYNIARPGRYTVQVAHEDPESKTSIKSNQITVVVSP